MHMGPVPQCGVKLHNLHTHGKMSVWRYFAVLDIEIKYAGCKTGWTSSHEGMIIKSVSMTNWNRSTISQMKKSWCCVTSIKARLQLESAIKKSKNMNALRNYYKYVHNASAKITMMPWIELINQNKTKIKFLDHVYLGQRRIRIAKNAHSYFLCL